MNNTHWESLKSYITNVLLLKNCPFSQIWKTGYFCLIWHSNTSSSTASSVTRWYVVRSLIFFWSVNMYSSCRVTHISPDMKQLVFLRAFYKLYLTHCIWSSVCRRYQLYCTTRMSIFFNNIRKCGCTTLQKKQIFDTKISSWYLKWFTHITSRRVLYLSTIMPSLILLVYLHTSLFPEFLWVKIMFQVFFWCEFIDNHSEDEIRHIPKKNIIPSIVDCFILHVFFCEQVSEVHTQ